MADLEFRRDLYQGTAGYYDRFRVPYPPDLIDDLADRAGADGAGRLLDLACGTGQLGFALHARFAEVWAVDQEPEMIAVVRDKARAAGLTRFRALACAFEDLQASAGSFDLVAVGNAFHRLPRDAVAASTCRWLQPGGFLALAWGGSPHEGEAPWQRTLGATMDRWKTQVQAHGRVPADYARVRRERPDFAILRDAGFEIVGRHQFAAVRDWTAETLAGYVMSTSVLSPVALGDRATEFADDLRRALHASQPDGLFRQTIIFACDLARRPA